MAAGRRPLEPDAEAKMDPEALVQCPYDKAHQIRVSRLPYHLVKCQRVSGAPGLRGAVRRDAGPASLDALNAFSSFSSTRTTRRWLARWRSVLSTPGTGCRGPSCRDTLPAAPTSACSSTLRVRGHPVPSCSSDPLTRTHVPIVPSVPTELSLCTGDQAKQPKVPVAWQAPPCQEDWEAGECPKGA